MATAVSDRIVWNYREYAGPYCVDHRSVQCKHAVALIEDRDDAPMIEEYFKELDPRPQRLNLLVPLWTQHFMWEELNFVLRPVPELGLIGYLDRRSTSQSSLFDLGVNRFLPGESAADLGVTLLQQFSDIMEVDRPKSLPQCKASSHDWKRHRALERLVQEARTSEEATKQLMPHLYGLLSRKMCAFCWGDAYGDNAKRVSGNAAAEAEADDFADLVPEG